MKKLHRSLLGGGGNALENRIRPVAQSLPPRIRGVTLANTTLTNPATTTPDFDENGNLTGVDWPTPPS